MTTIMKSKGRLEAFITCEPSQEEWTEAVEQHQLIRAYCALEIEKAKKIIKEEHMCQMQYQVWKSEERIHVYFS